MHPYLTFMQIDIPAYAVLMLFAAIAAVALAYGRIRVNGMAAGNLALALACVAAGFFFGAKLFTALLHLGDFLAGSGGLTFWQFLNNSGAAFYGGLLGGVLMLLLFARATGSPFWQAADSLIPSLLLFQSIAKIGCFFAGCCYGIACEHGLVPDPASPAPAGIALFPVQLAESAATFALFVFALIYGRIKRPPGKLAGVYFLGYGALRFSLEFLRWNPASEFLGPFSIAQWISLVLIALGVYFLVFFRPKQPTSVS